MMQPTKHINPDAADITGIAATEQDLLQHALSLFDMQCIQPVTMAFPNVISDTTNSAGSISLIDVNQLFTQQEQLFSSIEAPVSAPKSDHEAVAEAVPDESAELQAIQQMYAKS